MVERHTPGGLPRRIPTVLGVVVLGAAAILAGACSPMSVGRPVRPIPTTEHAAHLVAQRPRSVQRAHPLPAATLPEHPFMARHGASCMHSDPYTTNTHSWAGPVGNDPEVASRAMGFLGGECPTVNFDRRGRIVSVCVHNRTPSLVLLDPATLAVLDRRTLPTRRTPRLRFRAAADDTSGGAYFYLDEQDRAVIGTADGTIEVVALRDDEDGRSHFVLDERIDLGDALALPSEGRDKVTAVMPDWQGRYWFVTRRGAVGVVDTRHAGPRRVRSIRLPGEEIENSFSVAADGVYIVSDHALYRFETDATGAPSVVWREPYDRGTRRKVGQINRGSGTTPTLLGDDYVAIADNAEPRLNVLVYRRGRTAAGPVATATGAAGAAPATSATGGSGRRICATPVFEPGRSATENTLIGYGRSLVVENNAGYDVFFTMRHGRTSAPGLTRVDIREDESGCDVVWENDIISQTTVPKLSTSTGLIYVYAKQPDATDGADAYYFTAIDFVTGETAFRVLTGTGVRYDNHWAAITLAPDGTAFVGVLNGLLRIRDRVSGFVPASARPGSF